MTTVAAAAGAILGIGRSKAYELAKNGEFRVAIVRIGRRYLVPTSAVLALLGA
jgi:excisionase family DNA binding protein